MKKRLTVISIALLLTLLLCTPAMAAGTVCKIGSKGYSSLQEAVDNIRDGQTIKVMKAINAEESVRFPEKEIKFTIDFNKKKYTFAGAEGNWAAFFPMPGNTVTVKNLNASTETTLFSMAGTVIINSGTVSCNQLAAVMGNGVLKVKGGTYKGLSNWPFIANHKGGNVQIAKGSFKNKSDIINEGKVTITGGDFDCEREYQVYNKEGSTLTISGGKFASDKTIVGLQQGSSVTINGGTFSSRQSDHMVVKLEKGSTAKIKGGTFKGMIYTQGKMTITGGKSTSQVCVYEGGSCTINKFTINQKPSPASGPADGAMLVNQGGKLTVKGGKFVSRNGYGYSGDVTFSKKNYKKLFTVKALTP